MSSRLLRSVPLLVLAAVALGLLGAWSADPVGEATGAAGWVAGEAAGDAIVAPAAERTRPVVRAVALGVAAVAAGLLALATSRSHRWAPVVDARARSVPLRTIRRRGPPAGRAR